MNRTWGKIVALLTLLAIPPALAAGCKGEVEGHAKQAAENAKDMGEHDHAKGEAREAHAQDEAGEEHAHGEAGEEHEQAAPSQEKLAEIAARPCEHAIPIAECDECRYEAGLVKVPRDVAASLLETVEVQETAGAEHTLQLRCEVGTDRQATAVVTALQEGRVDRVLGKLGQRVQSGDVLAVLLSREAASARLDHFQAHRELEMAKLELDRAQKVHESLQALLDGLREVPGAQSSSAPPSPDAFGGLPAGEQKAALLVALNEYHEAFKLAEIERERLAEGSRLLGRTVQGSEAGAGAAPGADGTGIDSTSGPGNAGGGNGKRPRDVRGPYAGEWRRMIAEARETRDLAQKDLQRLEGLVKSGIRSSRELDAAKRDLAVAEAAYRAARETVGLEMDRRAVEVESALRSARIRLEGQSEEIALHLAAKLARARQALEEASAREALLHRALVVMGIGETEVEERLAPDSPELWKLEVRAPVPGTLVKLNLAPGATVARGDALMTLSDTESAWVWCDLYPQDLALLEEHPLPLPAVLSETGGRTVQGQLDYIERSADPHTRTVKARVVVTGTALRPGTFLSASVAFGQGGAGVFLPEEAVLADGEDRFVFVFWKDDLWSRRDVRTEPAGPGMVRVLSGLAPKDRVAVRGGFFLKSDVLREKMGAGCAD